MWNTSLIIQLSVTLDLNIIAVSGFWVVGELSALLIYFSRQHHLWNSELQVTKPITRQD